MQLAFKLGDLQYKLAKYTRSRIQAKLKANEAALEQHRKTHAANVQAVSDRLNAEMAAAYKLHSIGLRNAGELFEKNLSANQQKMRDLRGSLFALSGDPDDLGPF